MREDEDLTKVPVDELIRRADDEDDKAACVELDRRGIEPPMVDFDIPEPVPAA